MKIRLRKIVPEYIVRCAAEEKNTYPERWDMLHKTIINGLVNKLAEEFRTHITKTYTQTIDRFTGDLVFSCDLELKSAAEIDADYNAVKHQAQYDVLNAALQNTSVTDDYGNIVVAQVTYNRYKNILK